MDASFTSFRSRRDFEEDDDQDGRSTRTLSGLTAEADALQRPCVQSFLFHYLSSLASVCAAVLILLISFAFSYL